MAKFSFKTNVGDDRTAKITATWPVDVPELGVVEGDPFNLSDAQEIWWTFKLNLNESDEEAFLQKKASEDDITVDDIETNVAYMKLSRADLAILRPLLKEVKYLCDIQVKAATGDVWTVAEGSWKFAREITQGA